MFLFDHVDEVDDDDSTEVPEPELPSDGNGCLQIRAKNCLLEITMTDIGPGIHVNSRHRFHLIENQITAGL